MALRSGWRQTLHFRLCRAGADRRRFAPVALRRGVGADDSSPCPASRSTARFIADRFAIFILVRAIGLPQLTLAHERFGFVKRVMWTFALSRPLPLEPSFPLGGLGDIEARADLANYETIRSHFGVTILKAVGHSL